MIETHPTKPDLQQDQDLAPTDSRLTTGTEIISKQLPSEEDVQALVDKFAALGELGLKKQAEIDHHLGLLQKAEAIVRMHQATLGNLDNEKEFLDGCTQSGFEEILGITRLAGDDDHLSRALGILATETPRAPQAVLERQVRQYMAAKLFERGKIEMASGVLSGIAPSDPLIRASDLLLYMFAPEAARPQGIGQPYIYIEHTQQEVRLLAGKVSEFGLIGSPKLASRRLANHGLTSLSEQIPLNSCLLVSTESEHQGQACFVLTTDEIIFNPGEAVDAAELVPTPGRLEAPKMIVGTESIQALIDSLCTQTSQKEQVAQTDQVLKDMILVLFEQGFSIQSSDQVTNDQTASSSQFVLPVEHINRSILSFAKACAGDIGARLLENKCIFVGNYLRGGKSLELSNKPKTSKRNRAFSSQPIDMARLVHDSLDMIAGEGYVDVYLAANENNYARVVAAIISSVEESIRSNSQLWEADKQRLQDICDFLHQEVGRITLN